MVGLAFFLRPSGLKWYFNAWSTIGYCEIDYMVIDSQRVVLAKVRQLHVLHVGIPIGQNINVLVGSSKIAGNGYAWVVGRR